MAGLASLAWGADATDDDIKAINVRAAAGERAVGRSVLTAGLNGG